MAWDFDPTYEAWKRIDSDGVPELRYDFDPTYEAWKLLFLLIAEPLAQISILPTRHGNRISIRIFLISSRISILPTRHGNPSNTTYLNSSSFYFDPTYEAWKQIYDNIAPSNIDNFDPTYEAWKHLFLLPLLTFTIHFDPTYEAWKHELREAIKSL